MDGFNIDRDIGFDTSACSFALADSLDQKWLDSMFSMPTARDDVIMSTGDVTDLDDFLGAATWPQVTSKISSYSNALHTEDFKFDSMDVVNPNVVLDHRTSLGSAQAPPPTLPTLPKLMPIIQPPNQSENDLLLESWFSGSADTRKEDKTNTGVSSLRDERIKSTEMNQVSGRQSLVDNPYIISEKGDKFKSKEDKILTATLERRNRDNQELSAHVVSAVSDRSIAAADNAAASATDSTITTAAANNNNPDAAAASGPVSVGSISTAAPRLHRATAAVAADSNEKQPSHNSSAYISRDESRQNSLKYVTGDVREFRRETEMDVAAEVVMAFNGNLIHEEGLPKFTTTHPRWTKSSTSDRYTAFSDVRDVCANVLLPPSPPYTSDSDVSSPSSSVTEEVMECKSKVNSFSATAKELEVTGHIYRGQNVKLKRFQPYTVHGRTTLQQLKQQQMQQQGIKQLGKQQQSKQLKQQKYSPQLLLIQQFTQDGRKQSQQLAYEQQLSNQEQQLSCQDEQLVQLQPTQLSDKDDVTEESSMLKRTYTLSEALFTTPAPTFGALVLTEEERNTLLAEGFPVPTCLPLDAQEEKYLKRVRRKIKNKISAQESRRKKKEYTDTLELQMQVHLQEKTILKKKVDQLEENNRSLQQQLDSLRKLVRSSTGAAQGGTCVMALALFFAVFLGTWTPTSLNIGYSSFYTGRSRLAVSSETFTGPNIPTIDSNPAPSVGPPSILGLELCTSDATNTNRGLGEGDPQSAPISGGFGKSRLLDVSRDYDIEDATIAVAARIRRLLRRSRRRPFGPMTPASRTPSPEDSKPGSDKLANHHDALTGLIYLFEMESWPPGPYQRPSGSKNRPRGPKAPSPGGSAKVRGKIPRVRGERRLRSHWQHKLKPGSIWKMLQTDAKSFLKQAGKWKLKGLRIASRNKRGPCDPRNPRQISALSHSRISSVNKGGKFRHGRKSGHAKRVPSVGKTGLSARIIKSGKQILKQRDSSSNKVSSVTKVSAAGINQDCSCGNDKKELPTSGGETYVENNKESGSFKIKPTRGKVGRNLEARVSIICSETTGVCSPKVISIQTDRRTGVPTFGNDVLDNARANMKCAKNRKTDDNVKCRKVAESANLYYRKKYLPALYYPIIISKTIRKKRKSSNLTYSLAKAGKSSLPNAEDVTDSMVRASDAAKRPVELAVPATNIIESPPGQTELVTLSSIVTSEVLPNIRNEFEIRIDSASSTLPKSANLTASSTNDTDYLVASLASEGAASAANAENLSMIATSVGTLVIHQIKVRSKSNVRVAAAAKTANHSVMQITVVLAVKNRNHSDVPKPATTKAINNNSLASLASKAKAVDLARTSAASEIKAADHSNASAASESKATDRSNASAASESKATDRSNTSAASEVQVAIRSNTSAASKVQVAIRSNTSAASESKAAVDTAVAKCSNLPAVARHQIITAATANRSGAEREKKILIASIATANSELARYQTRALPDNEGLAESKYPIVLTENPLSATKSRIHSAVALVKNNSADPASAKYLVISVAVKHPAKNVNHSVARKHSANRKRFALKREKFIAAKQSASAKHFANKKYSATKKHSAEASSKATKHSEIAKYIATTKHSASRKHSAATKHFAATKHSADSTVIILPAAKCE